MNNNSDPKDPAEAGVHVVMLAANMASAQVVAAAPLELEALAPALPDAVTAANPGAQTDLPFTSGLPQALAQRVLQPAYAVAADADPALHVVNLAAVLASAALGSLPPPVATRGGNGEVPRAPETLPAFMDRMVPVVEAMVFAADHPLTLKEMVNQLRDLGEDKADAQTLEAVVERVRHKYSGETAGVHMVDVAGGYALRTSATVGRFLLRGEGAKPFRMGRAALETLAIIAYRQPVTKAQIDELRGVDSSGALKALLDKSVVRILGKAEEVGRPLLYGTTRTFLEAFNLRVLSDLPTLREFQELSSENQAKVDALGTQEALGRIRDLAKPGARLVSAEAESESSAAMAELDRAVGTASSTGRVAEAILKAGGKLPPGVDLETIHRGPATPQEEDAEAAAAAEAEPVENPDPGPDDSVSDVDV